MTKIHDCHKIKPEGLQSMGYNIYVTSSRYDDNLILLVIRTTQC